MNYYDYVLGMIPLALLGLTALLVIAGLNLTTAVPLAGGVSAAMIGHAMFVRAPTGSTADSPATASVQQ